MKTLNSLNALMVKRKKTIKKLRNMKIDRIENKLNENS